MKKIIENKKLIILIGGIIFLILCLLNFINKEEGIEEEISFNTFTKVKEITTKENESFYVDIKGNVKKPGVYKIKEEYIIQDIINLAGGLNKNSYTKNINLSKKVKDEMVIYIFTKDEINKVKKLNNCVCTPTYKYIECDYENEIPEIINPVEQTTISIITTEPFTELYTTKVTSTTKKIIIPTESILSTNKTTTTNAFKTSTTIKPTTLKTTTTRTSNVVIGNNLININTSNLEELITLKGLGEKKAQAVIEYRENNGPFKILEDIMKVNGIGKSTYEKIKDYIKV